MNAPEKHNPKVRKRLLVLTSATGGGHDTHAQATVDWCARIYGTDVEVIIEHALEDSHFIYRAGVAFYNFIQRRMPWFHHVYYNVVEFLELLNPGTVSLGRDYYIQLLKKNRPDAILSVMDCLNRGYFELAREVLGPEVKCATYCTEFTGGYGFSRNWVNPRTGYFFGRTVEAATAAHMLGIPQERTSTAGHWAPPSFYSPAPDGKERARYLTEKLQLDPDLFTLLLSTGGAGAQNHQAILHALLPLGPKIQVIALCGRNPQSVQNLASWVKRHASFAVRTLSFTTEMAALLQVSSAVVARAGATTAGEALLCGCPVIFNGMGGMMPQELPTLRYFRKHNMAFPATRPVHVRQHTEYWIKHPEEHRKLKQRMLADPCRTTPHSSLQLLLRD